MFAMTITSTSTVDVINLGTASTALVRSVTVCNTSTQASGSLDFSIVKSDSTTEYIVFRYSSVSTRQTIQPLTQAIVLAGGDKFRVQAPTGEFNVIASVLDIS